MEIWEELFWGRRGEAELNKSLKIFEEPRGAGGGEGGVDSRFFEGEVG